MSKNAEDEENKIFKKSYLLFLKSIHSYQLQYFTGTLHFHLKGNAKLSMTSSISAS